MEYEKLTLDEDDVKRLNEALDEECPELSKEQWETVFEYMRRKEEQYYKEKYEGLPLTVENIEKLIGDFREEQNLWDTYSFIYSDKVEDMEQFLIDNGLPKNFCECNWVQLAHYNWKTIIRLVNEDIISYNLHYYDTFNAVFFNFTKDGIKIETPFVNDNTVGYLICGIENNYYDIYKYLGIPDFDSDFILHIAGEYECDDRYNLKRFPDEELVCELERRGYTVSRQKDKIYRPYVPKI